MCFNDNLNPLYHVIVVNNNYYYNYNKKNKDYYYYLFIRYTIYETIISYKIYF